MADRIVAVMVRHGREQVACVSAPTKCDVAAITASQGTLRTNLTKGVKSLVDHHYEAREDPKEPFGFTIQNVKLAGDDRSAVVSVCMYDPVPVFEVKGAPDGTDVLINSQKASEYREYTVFLEAAEWRVGESKLLKQVLGENTCASK
jgi:hypothetical protein